MCGYIAAAVNRCSEGSRPSPTATSADPSGERDALVTRRGRGDHNPGASPRIASCSGESGRLKSGRARIVTGVIHFSSCSLVAGHVPWEHDGCWFDSSQLDCDVRELANPVHCECISDGIETRTSPKLSSADRTRCLLSRSEARSTRAESATDPGSSGRPRPRPARHRWRRRRRTN